MDADACVAAAYLQLFPLIPLPIKEAIQMLKDHVSRKGRKLEVSINSTSYKGSDH